MKLIDADNFKARLNNMQYVYLQACYEDLIDAIDCEVTYYKEEHPQGDLIEAIKTIKAVCIAHNDCVSCPMNRNCGNYPGEWEEPKGGAE